MVSLAAAVSDLLVRNNGATNLDVSPLLGCQAVSRLDKMAQEEELCEDVMLYADHCWGPGAHAVSSRGPSMGKRKADLP